MARPRKPTAVLELNGAFRKDPQRRASRIGEPIVSMPIGNPPHDLLPDVVECWREIVACCPPGVLTSADRVAVKSAARLMLMDNTGNIRSGDRAQLHRLLDAFGMTPRGRAYVKAAQPPKPKSRFLTV